MAAVQVAPPTFPEARQDRHEPGCGAVVEPEPDGFAAPGTGPPPTPLGADGACHVPPGTLPFCQPCATFGGVLVGVHHADPPILLWVCADDVFAVLVVTIKGHREELVFERSCMRLVLLP